jgi:TolB-like protein/Tfp pilus assembly protein PilF
MSFAKRIGARLREAQTRRLHRTLAVYGGTSMTLLGAVNLFSLKYGLPRQVFDLMFILLLCGLPCALYSHWRRAGGFAALGRGEAMFYGAMVLLALGLGARIILRARPSAPRPSGKTVAVLPFQNLSGNPEDEYFGDGVTEDIITHLSKISGLNVISRTSVMPYKKSGKSLRDIARELGATAILEGSVRRAGDRVRIVGQLIDAEADRHLWAETYDRQLNDLLAIQSEVAQAIARELRVRLSPEEKKRIARRPTENIEAYTFYIQGRERYYLYTAADNEAAIDLVKKALAADPNFAAAYAGLADAYAMGWRSFGYPESALDEALRLSDKAVGLDPNSAEGFKAMGLALESKGDELGGLNAYYKAVQLNPNYGPVVMNIGSLNFGRGQYDEALVWLRKAAELQPNISRVLTMVALQYYSLSLDKLAVAWLDRALALQPQSSFPNLVYADLELLGGRIEAARKRLSKILDLSPNERTALYTAGSAELLSRNWKEARIYLERLAAESGSRGLPHNALAYALQKLGDERRASALLDETLKGFLSDPDLDAPGSAGRYALAQTYALLGKKDEALDSFERALAGGYYDRMIEVDPLLSGLRPDPRFQAALKNVEDRLERMRARVRELGLDR